MSVNPIIKETAEDIIKICSPLQIFLVSHKTNSKGELSSFKLCIVVSDDYSNHAELETKILLETDCPVPCDIIVYNITDWNECLDDDFSFAYRIENEGNIIYEQGK